MQNAKMLVLVIWLGLAGCSQLSNVPQGELAKLSLPKLAPESVVLDVAFVRIPKQKKDFPDRFWPEVDEQAFENQLRRRLAANGFRCGLVSVVLPSALQEVLDDDKNPAPIDGVSSIRPGEEIVVHSQRLHARAAHPAKVLVRGNPVSTLAALTRDENGHVSGRSLQQAQLYFLVKAYPRGNGSVKLELTPVIEYGHSRSRFTAQQGAWTLDNNSRPTKVYDDLKIEAVVTPGQSVVLASTVEPRGLGQQFLAVDADDDMPSLVLLVRLQQTQLDDRFQQELDSEPIMSVAD